jgi:RNA polymerase sigma-70 factor (ECF subfamily)
MVRARGRREAHLVRPSAEHEGLSPELPDATQAGPDEQLLRAEQTGQLRVALGQLPEEHRAVLLLRYAEGMSYGEIAAALGLSMGTVMSRLFYGRRKLKQAFRTTTEVAS